VDMLSWLENWYAQACDGEWEHRYGVRIDTLDNPGWSLKVDLVGTYLEGRPYETLKVERSSTEWIHCSVKDGVFNGFGGPGNLKTLIATFRQWAEAGDREGKQP